MMIVSVVGARPNYNKGELVRHLLVAFPCNGGRDICIGLQNVRLALQVIFKHFESKTLV